MKNAYEIRGDVTAIFLRRRYSKEVIETLIDTECLPLAASITGAWCFSRGYVLARVGDGYPRLHRWITNAPVGKDVDHINHDTLDNRRSNLRMVSHSANVMNRCGPARNGSSGYRGVTLRCDKKKWIAQVAHFGKCYHIGSFETKELAATAAANYRREVFGCPK